MILIEHAHIAGNNIWHRGCPFLQSAAAQAEECYCTPSFQTPQVNWSTPLLKIDPQFTFLRFQHRLPRRQYVLLVADKDYCVFRSVTLSQKSYQGCRWTPFKFPADSRASAAAVCPHRILPTGLRRCERLCKSGSSGPWRQGKAHPLVAQRLEPQEKCHMQDPLCQVGRPQQTVQHPATQLLYEACV